MTDTTSSPAAQLRERMATRWGPALETPAEPAASVMLVGPEDRPVATPDTAHDPAAERWWILDPDGHRDLQGRKIGLPAGIQAQGWSCTGVSPRHGGEPWYAEVRRLSPAVLGHPLEARHGGDRKSVRVPNPAWRDGSGEPKTLVRKVTVPDAVPHGDIARWPHSFRPEGYDWGAPIACPTY